jgi:hypothetical protein
MDINTFKSFEDPKDEGYLLSKAALTRIPADGFSEYAARVWVCDGGALLYGSLMRHPSLMHRSRS